MLLKPGGRVPRRNLSAASQSEHTARLISPLALDSWSVVHIAGRYCMEKRPLGGFEKPARAQLV